MKYYSDSSEFIKTLIRIGDILLLNLLLFALYSIAPSFVPDFFFKNIKIVVIIANFALIMAHIAIPPLIHKRQVAFEKIVVRVFYLAMLQSAVFFVLVRIINDAGGFFRLLLFYSPFFFVCLLLLRITEMLVLRIIRHFGINTRSILFVGEDLANLMIFREMASDPSTGYKVMGYYADSEMEGAPADFKRLGTIADLNRLITQPNTPKLIDEVFCSLSHNEAQQVVALMQYCDKHVTNFYYVPRQFGKFHINLKPEQFGNQMILTNHQEPLTRFENRLLKRLFDIVVSFIVCLVMLPFVPIIALIIKLSSTGPVFFTQKRTGHNGKVFNCYKFRSMHLNADSDMQQASIDDPRKFPFGSFMRKTNLDEFPQFFNVLRGDMSIVGPRPHMLLHTEEYSAIIDKYMVRHFSKPGITGYAQVTGYRGETKELWQMEERVRRDIWYIENWTFWLDIKIILMTAFSLFVPDKKAY